jgi:ubiquinone/menaquinone biosynthesis C-methylase UbiE
MLWRTEMKPNVSDMFSADHDAQLWDAMYDGPVDNFNKYIFRKRRNFAIATVRALVERGASVLDLGCGAGPFTAGILRDNYNIFATDYSADILAKARNRIEREADLSVPILQCDSQKLPYQSDSFSAVVCLGVISYVPDRPRMVKEIHRALKQDGLLIITFRNFYNPIFYDPVNLVKYLLGNTPSCILHEKDGEFVPGAYLKPKEVRQLLETSGFKVVRAKGIGRGQFKLNNRRIFPLSLSIFIDKALEFFLSLIGFQNRLHGSDVVIYTCRKV